MRQRISWNSSNASVNVINHVTLVNIQTMTSVSAGKKLVDKLVEPSSVEECTENVEEAKIAEITSAQLRSIDLYSTENIHKWSSCTLHIVVFSIIFTINTGIATYFVYYKCMNHNKKTASRFNCVYQATNY